MTMFLYAILILYMADHDDFYVTCAYQVVNLFGVSCPYMILLSLTYLITVIIYKVEYIVCLQFNKK